MDTMMCYFKRFKILNKIGDVTRFVDCVSELNDYLYNNKESIVNSQIRQDLSNNFEKCTNKPGDVKCMLGIWRQYEWVHLCLFCIENKKRVEQLNLSKFCKNRPKVSQDLKLNVWHKRNSNNNHERGVCYCCEEALKFSNMQCGHVLPHCKGGDISLANLEPICKTCNNHMGIMNLDDFKAGLRDTHEDGC
jgi:5-methylcytosine-specific restriction endonuclease McrA